MTHASNDVRNTARVLLFLAGIGSAAPADAQNDIDRPVWTAVSVQGGAGRHWRWASDTLVRATGEVEALDIVGERVTLARTITPRSSVGAGYAWAAGSFHGRVLQEHRIVEQYTWSGTGRVRISLRSRLEESWLTGNAAMQLRTRQRVKVVFPLLATGALQGVASEELFLQPGAATRLPRHLDRNEAFAGIARRLTARSGVEIGYVNVYSKDGYRGHHRSHALSATLGVSR